MAALTPQQITYAGLTPSYAAVGGSGDTFPPGENMMIHVKNGGGGATSVTVAVPGNQEIGVPNDDVVVSVNAAGDKLIGPFPSRVFRDPSTGQVHVTCSPTTSVTIAALVH